MDRTHQWLALIANAGVIIGIALLIVELRQNDQVLSEELKLREAMAFREIESEYLEADRIVAVNPQLAEIRARAFLDENPKFSRQEITQLLFMQSQYARIDHTAFRFWVAGHLSPEAFRETSRNVQSSFSGRGILHRAYMINAISMPEDFRTHFNISDYPEELLDLSEFAH